MSNKREDKRESKRENGRENKHESKRENESRDEMTQNERPIITVDNMHVSFNGRDVTHGVSLSLFPGRITALVGESGSGKSVTALALPHLDPSIAGVRGTALLKTGSTTIDLLSPNAPLNTVRGGEIGTIFQEPMTAFNPLVTIGDQISEALVWHGQHMTRSERRARVMAQLHEVGLPDAERIMRSHPHELSGGQLQRAMIAMAIINRPRVVIADEPTTALDVTTQKAILQLLERLTHERQLAVLLITHDMAVVWQAADDVYVMHDGRICEHGDKQQIFTHPHDDYTKMLLNAVPRLDVASLKEASKANARDWAEEKKKCHCTQQDLQQDAQQAAQQGSQQAAQQNSPQTAATTTNTTNAPTPVIRVEHLSVTYGHGRASRSAVSDVNFSINAGETLALVGESGAGKSTIARVLSGQLRPQSGHVFLRGVDMTTLRGHALREASSHTGYVFQDSGSALNPAKTVGWSIAEPLQIQGWSQADRNQRVRELLDQVSLPSEMADRYPSELSGGQKQRIGIARALALQPSLLIADEPTSALDVTVQKRILDLLHQLRCDYGYACLFITHDLGIVQEVADRVAVIRAGKLVEQGSMVDVLTHPRDAYTRTLLAASPTIDVQPQA